MKFNPTQTQIDAASAVFIAMAHEGVIREIVEKYQKDVLSRHQFVDRYDGKIITDIKNAWSMTDEDFTTYWAECNIERRIAGLKVETDDHCPLLVAENLTRQAKRNLINACEEMFSISADDLLCSGLENYNKYIELLLGLFAPLTRRNKYVKSILS